MSILEFTALLSLLGGAIYVTFQITWTVSHSDDKDKKNDQNAMMKMQEETKAVYEKYGYVMKNELQQNIIRI